MDNGPMVPSAAGEFDGRVAMVTGAASGIGLATARALATQGAALAMVDIDAARVQQAAEALRAEGFTAAAWQADLSQADAVADVTTAIGRHFGALHLAVNNAGVSGTRMPLAEQSLENWHRVIDNNLNAVFYAMREQIPLLLAQGGGAIVNVASVLATVGSALAPAYTAAKHGVLGLTRSAALAYAARGIRINAVAPGYIRTPLLGSLGDQETRAIAAAHPLGRLGEAQEIAQAALFLLSPRSAFATGSLLMADGGFTAR